MTPLALSPALFTYSPPFYQWIAATSPQKDYNTLAESTA
jgi:hypothetical protein